MCPVCQVARDFASDEARNRSVDVDSASVDVVVTLFYLQGGKVQRISKALCMWWLQGERLRSGLQRSYCRFWYL